MEKKSVVLFAIMTIAVLVLAGCQGYKPPKYESNDSKDVDVDLSEAGDNAQGNVQDEEYVPYDENSTPDDEYAPYDENSAPKEESAPKEAEVNHYKSSDDSADYQKADYKTLDDYQYESTSDKSDKSDNKEFVEAAYEPLYEEENDSIPSVTVNEGETVHVNVKASDLDGDSITYVYTAPLNSEGEWRTRTGDRGVYYSTITVSDGKTDVVKKVKIIVEPKNNKPVLEVPENITVNEGDVVQIHPQTFDADGDKLTVSYSGWMTSQTKQTNYDDAGEHTVTVTVSDGISRVSQDITVIVNDVNRPPQVEIEF